MNYKKRPSVLSRRLQTLTDGGRWHLPRPDRLLFFLYSTFFILLRSHNRYTRRTGSKTFFSQIKTAAIRRSHHWTSDHIIFCPFMTRAKVTLRASAAFLQSIIRPRKISKYSISVEFVVSMVRESLMVSSEICTLAAVTE